MSTFRADLHIHSRFSRATSSRLTVPHLAAWAGVKGIDVLATGDFTHPQWRAELREALTLDESSSLLRLRKPLGADDVAREIPALAGLAVSEPRFMLEAEISSIYKKHGAVRKVHSLVYVPDFESADRLCARLERIGNLGSDGRPILGLDVRHLLEMVLEIPRAFLIPAHVWTPWFSLFGSKSGFNSLEECFGDLTPHVFALETGLSSDPDMNRCWSALDHLTLVSNSDAHSGENLAREATLFTGQASYDGIFNALRGLEPGYAGTLEFFPEEGKYHLDGHRACHVVLEPEECRRLNDICPVCGKPLTVGVLHRVLELADRPVPPKPGAGFLSLIPLPEIVGEILHCGPKTKRPQQKVAELTRRFGPELTLLLDTPLTDVGRHWPELGEALRRMRAGQVIRQGGYDGEYGVIRLFEPGEMGPSLLAGASPARSRALPGRAPWPAPSLLSPPSSPAERPRLNAAGSVLPAPPPPPDRADRAERSGRATPSPAVPSGTAHAGSAFSPDQERALTAGPGPVLVLAGPGSGKTRTLVGRVAHLVESGVPPSAIVAVTFTRRAAGEIRERLAAMAALPETDTLHALALKHWPGPQPVVLGEEAARRAFAAANSGLFDQDSRAASTAWDELALARERLRLSDLLSPHLPARVPAYVSPHVEAAARAYTAWKKARHLADYTDLLETWLNLLRSSPDGARPWTHVLVDEVQDLSPLQRALVCALLPPDGTGFFGIGDPDQSIYGFRGADASIAERLREVWPGLRVLSLGESHRAAPAVLTAAQTALGPGAACAALRSVTGRPATLQWLRAPSAEREAAWVADRAAYLVGGTSHQQADLREELAGCHLAAGSCSPGDMAVLVRLKALIPPLRAALERRGIPCAAPESEAFWTDARVELLLQGAALFVRGQDAPPGFALNGLPSEAWRQGPAAVLAAAEGAGRRSFDPLFGESLAFRKLLAAYRDAAGDWRGVLDFVSLRQELDMVRARSEQVQIMTLHAAKGLEFRVVFLPCLEDGLLPFRGTEALVRAAADREDAPGNTPKDVEVGKVGEATAAFGPGDALASLPDSGYAGYDEAEERRLLYVGLTRAAEAVFASSAGRRTLYGRTLTLPPSPLVPGACFRAVTLTRRTRVLASQLSLLR